MKNVVKDLFNAKIKSRIPADFQFSQRFLWHLQNAICKKKKKKDLF